MRLLLDAHISPDVARDLANQGIEAVSMQSWRGGVYLEDQDEAILNAAFEDDRVLVTYDVRTIPKIIQRWGESQMDHAGVIFVDRGSIPQGDRGMLLRGILEVLPDWSGFDWRNRSLYLPRPRERDG